MTQLSQEQRAKIQAQAQEILNTFSKTLESVKISKTKDTNPAHSSGFREEGKGKSASDEFRQQMFKNAPKHNNESIIAEKKEW